MSLKRKAADITADAAKKAKPNASITSFFSSPKAPLSTNSTAPNSSAPASSPIAKPAVTKAEPAAAPAPFDKEAWVAKLKPEQKELLKLEINTLHESWLAVLKDEVVSESFLTLKRFLKSEAESGKTIFPPSQDVYSWYADTYYLPDSYYSRLADCSI